MKKLFLYILGLVLVYGMYSVKDFIQGNKTFEDSDGEREYLYSIVKDKCTKKEKIDRWLLHQGWFYSENFKVIAMAFGETSFSFYEKGKPTYESHDGAFCIEGRKLIAKYYKRSFVPVSIHFPDDGLIGFKMGTKITLGEDVIIDIKEMTQKKLVLNFSDNNEGYTFYRKN